MSKADAIKAWKPEMKAFGFPYKEGVFLYERPDAGHLDFAVSVQKNVRADTYKVNASIVFRNPLVGESQLELLIDGNVRADGIFLHVDRSSWWAPEALPNALAAFKTRGMEWYRRVGRIDYLANVAETAIREVKDIVDIIEPIDMSAAPDWLDGPPRRLGSTFFYRAAILHYLNGDREKAIGRTNDWLAAISTQDVAQQIKARAQLTALTRPN
jgi:hypothetical protein